MQPSKKASRRSATSPVVCTPQFKIPPALKPGDTVGIAAPASPVQEERFFKGLAVLESLGVEAVYSKHIFAAQGYLAASDEARARELNQFFKDPSIKAILCARGGFGSMRIIPRLDFDLVRSQPKLFLGYSDISALLWTLFDQGQLVTLHGPTVVGLDRLDGDSLAAFADALFHGKPIQLQAQAPLALRGGEARGVVVGGNLTTLCHLAGTPFAPRWNNRILVLEDCGEAPYRIDRMLSQLKLAGCLGSPAGVVLGDFTDCGPMSEVHAIFKDMIPDCPMVAGFSFGHGPANQSLPIGLTATLDVSAGRLSYHRGATCRSEVSSEAI
jgi:muramoyltetrapeptide carboxypeptidase